MKKLFSFIFLFVMGSLIFLSVDISAKTQSGTCGATSTWTLDEKGILTIQGTGAASDCSFSDELDEYLNKNARVLIISEGITDLSDFTHLPDVVKKVIIPRTLVKVVNKFGGTFLDDAPALRTLVNNSSLILSLSNQYGNKTWTVDDKKATTLSCGKTAYAKGKKYKIKYNLKGGKLKGKKVTSYEFGTCPKILCTATKKGYIFGLWKTGSMIYGVQQLNPSFSGNITLSPKWIKIKAKNTKRKKIHLTISKSSISGGLEIQYSSHKNMSSSKSILYNKFTDSNKKTISKLKKGKTYYIRFRERGIGDEANSIGNWFGKIKIRIRK